MDHSVLFGATIACALLATDVTVFAYVDTGISAGGFRPTEGAGAGFHAGGFRGGAPEFGGYRTQGADRHEARPDTQPTQRDAIPPTSKRQDSR